MSYLDNIYIKRKGKRKRFSSYDRSGGNDDRFYVPAGETVTFAEMDKPGIIRHIWVTIANSDFKRKEGCFRNVVVRMYWDGEENPSALAPIGDFFGMGHDMSHNFVSEPLQMSPENGQALNCWWPMPYSSAKLTVENQNDDTLVFYYYVDYEECEVPDEALRFHALWHRERTVGKDEGLFPSHDAWCFEGKNTTGEDNYLILDAEGSGQYCGCNINIDNKSDSALWDWVGEGDDMIYIDGDKFPTLHGTGTEDYVNMAWCPTQEYSAPYHGLILGGDGNWKGKITYYRYHIADPIMFDEKIKVTIEHGHANNRSDDWTTTAYWYQTEPHKPHQAILPQKDRLPD